MDFKQFYKTVQFDIDKEIRTILQATQGDTKSRGLLVPVVVNSVVTPITTETMNFFALKPDGTRVMTAGVKDGDKFRIDFTNQTFAVPGVLLCTLVLYGTSGEKIADRKFKMTVDSNLEDGAIISEDERGILDRAFDLANDIVPRLEALDVPLLENLEQEVITARGTEATLGTRLDSTDAQLNEIEQRIDNLVATPVQPINTSFLTLVEDVNEIPKALKAASLQDFIDSTENIYLKDYRAGFDGALATSATYDTLKLFVEPGDVIRSKTFFYVLEDDSAAQLYYASFFREDGTLIRMDLLWFPESANPNWATLKENGLSAPEGTAFCYINLHNDYWYQKSELHPRYSDIATNGKEAEVITVNKDRTYTDFNEIGILPNYTPMEDHYVFDKDVEIRKYDEALGDIKTVLASLVEVS